MRSSVLLLLLALTLGAVPAAARDLCFNDANEAPPIFVFKKIKLPTKPNDAVPLAGLGLSGTASTNEVGSLLFVVTTSSHCIAVVSFDSQLVGTASTVCMSSGSGVTGSVTVWRPVSCEAPL